MADAPRSATISARTVRRRLLDWFRQSARDLPWRRTTDPYRIWLSEVMLQQTRVETVRPYYRRFLRAFPNVRRLAAADLDEVLKLWEGLGYYGRARNLHRAAQVIVEQQGGRFPKTAEALARLPGVGRYTAGAIASIAFGQQTPVLDGNVKRVLARLYALDAPIDDHAVANQLWQLADALVPPGDPGAFNQALMELGARVCTPRTTECDKCPIRGPCRARAGGLQQTLPVRRPKRPVPHHEIIAAAIRKNSTYLIGKRPPKGMLGGLWEFPGGKVEPGETLTKAVLREVEEETGLQVRVDEKIATVRHAYTHFKITLHLFRCSYVGGRVRRTSHDALRWVPRSHFDRYAFPAANYKCLDHV
jgi:A/G-specific adenine glycosylase